MEAKAVKGMRRSMAGGRRRKADQLTFDRHCWGGTRPGAGRKRVPGAGVSHGRREELAARFPVHVTVRLCQGLASLRRGRAFEALRVAFAKGCDKDGFRLVHYSVQTNHVHMLVEAQNRVSLARGMQGLVVRVARGLNRAWRRTGRVFADRYHARILRTPRHVRSALCYVLCNARKHRLAIPEDMPDPFSSGDVFDGWSQRFGEEPDVTSLGLVARARTWLLQRGWRRHGPIPLGARPGAT